MSDRKTSYLKTAILLILFLACCFFAPEIFGISLYVLYSVTFFPILLLANYTDHMGLEVIGNGLDSLMEAIIFIFIGVGLICLPIMMALGRVQGEGFSSSGSLSLKKDKIQKSFKQKIERFFFYSVWATISLLTIYGLILTVVTVKYSILYSLFFFIPMTGVLGLILKKKWARYYCALVYFFLAAIFFHLPFTLELTFRYYKEITVSTVLATFFSLCSFFLIKTIKE